MARIKGIRRQLILYIRFCLSSGRDGPGLWQPGQVAAFPARTRNAVDRLRPAAASSPFAEKRFATFARRARARASFAFRAVSSNSTRCSLILCGSARWSGPDRSPKNPGSGSDRNRSRWLVAPPSPSTASRFPSPTLRCAPCGGGKKLLVNASARARGEARAYFSVSCAHVDPYTEPLHAASRASEPSRLVDNSGCTALAQLRARRSGSRPPPPHFAALRLGHAHIQDVRVTLRAKRNSNLPLVGRSKFAKQISGGVSASPWIGGDPRPKNAKGVFRPAHKGEVE